MSQARASSQPPPSAQPETAAIIGVLHAASRFQNAAAGWRSDSSKAALAQRADVGAGREDLVGAGDHDAADLGVGVEPLERGRELLHHLGREGVAGLRAVEPAQGDVSVDARSRRGAQPLGGSHRVDPGRGAADDQLLDLRRALVEGGHAGVAQVALDRIVVDVARAAVDLDRQVRALDRRLGRV